MDYLKSFRPFDVLTLHPSVCAYVFICFPFSLRPSQLLTDALQLQAILVIRLPMMKYFLIV